MFKGTFPDCVVYCPNKKDNASISCAVCLGACSIRSLQELVNSLRTAAVSLAVPGPAPSDPTFCQDGLFFVSVVRCGSREAEVATEHLKCDQCI